MELLELPGGIRRVTCPLPTRPGHVHAYLLPGADGWTLVDTGIGLPDAEERWAAALAPLDGDVVRILVTHFHPDHVGAAADVARVTAAPVHQGELDYAQCELVWGNDGWPRRIADWFLAHGVPSEITEELIESGQVYRPFIRYQPDPVLVHEGDRLDGWELVAAPGHADGQLCLLQDGVLVSADHLLGRISPTVGLWPESRPDPLGDFLASLRRTIELAPRLALPGHGEPLEDPVGRAHELIEHHRERLGATEAALGDVPRSGFEVSFDLFGAEHKPAARRFAVAETLSHLERLVLEGRAERVDDGGTTLWRRRPRVRA
ncbi:MAG TPA: MBL fold metallo-hydrolase [Gaiellaceae bacterium]|nr:MBL fold metallo-hydrolase [Gaiellaceae bacterium]